MKIDEYCDVDDPYKMKTNYWDGFHVTHWPEVQNHYISMYLVHRGNPL